VASFGRDSAINPAGGSNQLLGRKVIPIVSLNTVFALGRTGVKEPVLEALSPRKTLPALSVHDGAGPANTAFDKAIGIKKRHGSGLQDVRLTHFDSPENSGGEPT
jgi:hypothetical protein